VVDGTQPLPFARKFDRILVDAPCSGTGTLARNPEIKWKLREEDIGELQGRQAALLRNALGALRPGGVLVYSTCSLEEEENEGVLKAAGLRPVDRSGDRFAGLEACPTKAGGTEVVETMERVPGRDPGDGFFAAVIKLEKPANG